MKVSFEFELSEEEADTLMEIVSDAIYIAGQKASPFGGRSEVEGSWWRKRTEYLAGIKAKMKSWKVA